MTSQQKAFLYLANAAAQKAGHIFPEMAACEAAEESAFGTSKLATEAFNLFGMKIHRHCNYPGRINLPTREFENGAWIQTTGAWVVYPDWASCFADRMSTLQRLASFYPHYLNALEAGSPVTYINEVSKTWATDPRRAEKCLAIYDEIAGDWSGVQN